ncbi:hypothetical protein B0H14DRAFT_2590324 [Mycena olivaceomarginata]|nr:hypothetical protein B0H14DRAFT_2590324 [Mycena olivaceomarginata]
MHGIVVLKIKRYLPGNYVGWIMIIVGFGVGISTIYGVMIGVSGLGLLCVLFMKEVPRSGNVDAKFGLKEKGEKGGKGDVEKGSVEKAETETETDEKAEVETEEVAEVERLEKV